MTQVFSIQDKVVWITGAGKGIGRETALHFAREGAKLALLTRTSDDYVSLKQEWDWPEQTVFAVGDASNPKDVDAFAKQASDMFGRVDVVINNAGMRFRKPFAQTSWEEWNHVMQVNLGSAFLVTRKALALMSKQKSGSVINMSSIAGVNGLAELSAYTASKGAMVSMTKSLALELAKDGIRVNAVAPGFCETSYTENFKKKEAVYQFTLDRTPLGHWGQPKDVAHACHYLASDASAYVTGEVLMVDGGWNAA